MGEDSCYGVADSSSLRRNDLSVVRTVNDPRREAPGRVLSKAVVVQPLSLAAEVAG